MTATFSDFGLSDTMLQALAAKGFTTPTPIQAKTIPILMEHNRDVIGQAQTGTGKTAAFGIPIVERLEGHMPYVQAVVLCPTRELAIQVAEEIDSFKGNKRLKVIPIYGGQSIMKQAQDLQRGVDIIVGTPGRVIDHLTNGRMNLSKIDYLILDEADEMLNIGFIDDIETIMAETNPTKQTLLFSATMPDRIVRLAERYMKTPEIILTKSSDLTTDLTEQVYFEVNERDKSEALIRVLNIETDFYGLIFCKTKRDVDDYTEMLLTRGYDAEALHGDISQHQRERIMDKFKKRITKVLVATDVAARGIDVSNLSHVINLSLPQEAESYIHRIGRTGRAGQKGKAISIIAPDEFRKLRVIERLAKTQIKKADVPSVKDIIAVKKQDIQSKISTLMEKGKTDDDYFSLAEAILNEADPAHALASVLKLAYKRELDPSGYKEIRPVFEKSSSRDSRSDRGKPGFSRNDSRSFRDRDTTRGFSRNDRPYSSNRDSSYGNGFSRGNSSSGELIRLFVANGRKESMTPRKLTQFLEEKTNIFASKMKNVQIFDNYSFISVTDRDAKVILNAFRADGGRPLVELAQN